MYVYSYNYCYLFVFLQVLFCERAKLFRFTEGVFLVRGLGDLKILQHKQTGKVRVVMRREVVHKICANFNLQDGLLCFLFTFK